MADPRSVLRRTTSLSLGLLARLLVLLTVAFLVFQTAFRAQHDPYHVLYRYVLYVVELLSMGTARASSFDTSIYVRPAIVRSVALFAVPIAAAFLLALGLARSTFVRRKRRLARTLEQVGSAAYAVPVFFLAMVLFVFASETRLFPIGMTASPGFGSMGPVAKLFDLLHHLVLPWVTLFLLPALTLMRQAELEVDRLEQADAVLASIGRGATRREVFRHDLRRPIVISLVRRLASDIPLYVTYLVIVEVVFLYSGLGYYVVWPYTSYSWRDTSIEFATSQSALVYLGAFTVLAQFAARALLVALDPRYGGAAERTRSALPLALAIGGAVVLGAFLAAIPGMQTESGWRVMLPLLGGVVLLALSIAILRHRLHRLHPRTSDLPGSAPWIERPGSSAAAPAVRRPRAVAWPGWVVIGVVVLVPWIVPRPERPPSMILVRPDVLANPELLWYYFRSAVTAGRGLVIVIGCSIAGVLIGGAGGTRVGLHHDRILDRLFETGAVFPAVLIVVASIGMIGSRPPALLASLTLVAALRFYPHARDSVRLLGQASFAGYARVLGERDGEFVIRHVIPNFVRLHGKPMLLLAADLVVLRANLAFLGLTASRWSLAALVTGPEENGVLPAIYEAATLDWGLMLTDVRSEFVRGLYAPSIFPALFLILFVLVVRRVARRLP